MPSARLKRVREFAKPSAPAAKHRVRDEAISDCSSMRFSHSSIPDGWLLQRNRDSRLGVPSLGVSSLDLGRTAPPLRLLF
jgi:hypothetical protein